MTILLENLIAAVLAIAFVTAFILWILKVDNDSYDFTPEDKED